MNTDSNAKRAALLRLLQLTSPALPVGAFAYSQGLEYAVNARWVHDEATARDWICGLLCNGLARLDAPVLARLYAAWSSYDEEALEYWSAMLHASREARELQEEDGHLGAALARLLRDLELPQAAPWVPHAHTGYAVLFALAAAEWRIALPEAVSGYLWAWCEAQVAAAIKLVPLGQTAGQRILSRVVMEIPTVVDEGLALADDEIGYAAPRLAIGSALHETQYSRLFRS